MDEFLREAEEAYRHGLYASAVVMSHATVRLRLATRLRKEEGSLRDMAAEAYRDGIDVDVKSLGKLSWIKNRVVHEGYLPKREEARWAVRTATNSLGAMKRRGLLRRVLGWLARP
jgi:HEPN domain-containing protein